MKRAALPFAFALAACATMPSQARPTVGLGQVATVDGIRVRPLSIIEDSRCPINAVCVWAGRIVVRTEVRASARREIHSLELGKPLPIDGGTLTLTEVEPSQLAGSETEPRAYRFTFRYARQPR